MPRLLRGILLFAERMVANLYLCRMANRLINEQSPYLLQHAHNPVDWRPWGDEAFEEAKAADKPVIVSIGYAACHWCHVMERESFENPAIAEYMNEHFVCIKVDREEHPDVDQLYMDAVQAIGGSGGWPLNVFVTPDRVPFYGGTYYPPRPAFNRPSWIQLLQRMNEIWTEQHDEVTHQAGQMLKHLQQAAQHLSGPAGAATPETAGKIAESLLKQADKEKGGFGNAPKFPGTMAISYLIEHNHFAGHEPSLRHALHSLDAMIDGGIYDQVGGGFSRYATDRNWLIPHFEKMLYDNALLVCALCDAWSVTRNDKYRRIIAETIAFVERELKDPAGGYYCALDADSEGVEGKFYTWTWEEWVAVMGEDSDLVRLYFGVTPGGNWEETNILSVVEDVARLAAMHKVEPQELQSMIDSAVQKLFTERAKRIRPITDDKCLLSWNALMNIALTKAGTVLHGADTQLAESYLARAAGHTEWMLRTFKQGDILLHTWKNGVARIPAKLDDYAYLVQALLQAASALDEPGLVHEAAKLTEIVISEFSAGDTFFYFSAASQQDIPVRKVDLYDGATPSANSVMAHNLLLLGMCVERTDWLERAQLMLSKMVDTATRYSYSFSYWAQLLQRQLHGFKTVVLTGDAATAAKGQLAAQFLPAAFLVTSGKQISDLPVIRGKNSGGELAIFVCTEQACLPPVNSAEQAIVLASGR